MIRQEIRDAKLQYRNELRVFAHSWAVAPPSPNVDPRPLYSLGALLLSIATGASIALVRARRAKYGAPGESAYRRQADIFMGSQEMPEDRGLPAGIYRQDLTSTSTSSHLALAVARTTAQKKHGDQQQSKLSPALIHIDSRLVATYLQGNRTAMPPCSSRTCGSSAIRALPFL